jgi:hypothetical protein
LTDKEVEQGVPSRLAKQPIILEVIGSRAPIPVFTFRCAESDFATRFRRDPRLANTTGLARGPVFENAFRAKCLMVQAQKARKVDHFWIDCPYFIQVKGPADAALPTQLRSELAVGQAQYPIGHREVLWLATSYCLKDLTHLPDRQFVPGEIEVPAMISIRFGKDARGDSGNIVHRQHLDWSVLSQGAGKQGKAHLAAHLSVEKVFHEPDSAEKSVAQA